MLPGWGLANGKPSLLSAALITDDPHPEVAAAGHDRSPIPLKRSRRWIGSVLQVLTRRWRFSKRNGSGPIFRIAFWVQPDISIRLDSVSRA